MPSSLPRQSNRPPDAHHRKAQRMDLGNGYGHLDLLDPRPPRRHLGGDAGEPGDVPPGGQASLQPGCADGRVPADLQLLGGDAHQRPGRARVGEGVPRRQRPLRLHGQRVPLRPLQGRDRQGARVRAGLEHRGAHPLHDERGEDPHGDHRPGGRAHDPERSAGLPPQGGRRRLHRRVHREPAARGGVPDGPREEHRSPGQAGPRAGALLLPGDHRGDGRVLQRLRLHPRRGRPGLAAERAAAGRGVRR